MGWSRAVMPVENAVVNGAALASEQIKINLPNNTVVETLTCRVACVVTKRVEIVISIVANVFAGGTSVPTRAGITYNRGAMQEKPGPTATSQTNSSVRRNTL